MKLRITTLAIATCLVSSLAFADNPSDAPLQTNDATITAVQRETRAHDSRWRANKKDQSAKPKCESVSQNNQKAEPARPEASMTSGN